MKAIDYFLDDVDAIDENHEKYVTGIILKCGPRCFFCNLEGHFTSDCTQVKKEAKKCWKSLYDERMASL